MNDLISRSALLNELIADYAYAAADIVKAAPAVDAVEVVRCKDCKWSFHDLTGNGVALSCEMWDDYRTTEEGYCHRSERRNHD